VNLTGFTASPQPLWWWNDVCPGEWGGIGTAAVPPKSANFDVVTGWIGWNYDLDAPATLDSNVWLPQFPNSFGLLSGQPAEFLVGPEGDTSGYNEGDPTGGMTYFPFARLKRNGADGTYIEDLTIRNRFKAHDGLALNVALPYYPGTYAVNVTDNGQMSSGYPLLGWDASPSVFIWKDGLVKFSTWNYCNDHWWGALSIYSGVSGTGATYDDGWADCGSSSFGPYGP
jgi:hypothetical protein